MAAGYVGETYTPSVLRLRNEAWEELPSLPGNPGGGALRMGPLQTTYLIGTDEGSFALPAEGDQWVTLALPRPAFARGTFGHPPTTVEFGGHLFGLPGPWQRAAATAAYDPADRSSRPLDLLPDSCRHNAAHALIIDERILLLGVTLDLAIKPDELPVTPCWLDPQTGSITPA